MGQTEGLKEVNMVKEDCLEVFRLNERIVVLRNFNVKIGGGPLFKK